MAKTVRAGEQAGGQDFETSTYTHIRRLACHDRWSRVLDEVTIMNLAIELPEAIGRELEAKWGDLSSRAREAIAIEAYRSGALSEAQVQQLLGLATRSEVDEVLKRAGAYLEYT